MTDVTFKLKDTEYALVPFGGPLDAEPDHELFRLYGYAVAACGRLEYIATMLALTINDKEENPALYKDDPDWRYPEMVRLIKRWITQHPAYSFLDSPENEVFFKSLIEYAELRNALVHCLIERFDPATQRFGVHSVKKDKEGNWRFKCLWYDIEVLKHLASQSNLAARHFNEIAKAVFDTAA